MIHPTAIIEPDAHIGTGVTIRENCYVGHHAHIGDGVVLFPNVVVGDGAQIGDASVLKKVFSRGAAQTLFIQAVSNWNGASVELSFLLRKAF